MVFNLYKVTPDKHLYQLSICTNAAFVHEELIPGKVLLELAKYNNVKELSKQNLYNAVPPALFKNNRINLTGRFYVLADNNHQLLLQ